MASNFLRFVLTFQLLTALAAEPDLDKSKVPPQVTQALAGFHLKRGFRIELVAAEPNVVAPVAIAFDENGRLFVAEMRDYPAAREENPHLGRVRLLEDTDGDGKPDANTVYASDLAWPSGIACSAGGVFVAATPEIVFLKDSQPGGAADLRKVVFNGFGTEGSLLKVDALLNSFAWGLDNRIHVATAGVGGFINALRAPGAAQLDLDRQDFSFDPLGFTMSPETGPAQSGLAFDSHGRRFLCDFSRPLRQPISETRYLARNRFFPKPNAVINISGGATPLFRIFSGKDASRSPAANPPVMPTHARSSIIYRGGVFPASYAENVFFADSAAGVVHHAVLREQGLGWIAERAPDEINTEFLLCSDAAFQPVQLTVGPEGALYVVDLHGGGNNGRIYRILPEKFQSSKFPQLGKAKTYDLVGALAHTNGWIRDTAARLLYERHEMDAVPLLTNMFNRSRLPLARLHALHALDGLGGLNQGLLLKGLTDPDETVREHSVLLSERMVHEGSIADPLWNQLKGLAADPAIHVRYQLALTAGEIRRPDKIAVLGEILRRDVANPWIHTAVLSSLDEGSGQMFLFLVNNAQLRNDAAGLTFLQTLLTMIGLGGREGEGRQVVDWIVNANLPPQQAFNLLYPLGEGLRRAGGSFTGVDPQNRLQLIYDGTVAATLNDSLAEPLRLAAIRLRGVSPYAASAPGDFLQVLFGSGQSEAVQTAGLVTLARYNNPTVSGSILTRLQLMNPNVRKEAVTVLLSRPDGVAALLASIENGAIRPSEVTSVQQDFLRSYRDPASAQRAFTIFGPPVKERPALVERFRGALASKGDAAAGRQIFQSRCARCHQAERFRPAFAGELVDLRSGGKEKILRAILEPSAEIAPENLTYVIQTQAGENLFGLIPDQNQQTVTVRQAAGDSVWARGALQSVQGQPWSLMPQGLEEGLGQQAMADLLEYVATAPR